MSFSAETLGLPSGMDVLLSGLIQERTGLHFDNGRRDLLADKLSPLVIERGFTSFLDYYYLLKYDAEADQEWRRVLNALSVPETYFWREMDQIRALAGVVVPSLLSSNPLRPVRIWSAACASGEEPLTIAMALREAGWLDSGSVEIYASDASTNVLERARAGLYRERSFRHLPEELRLKYFSVEGTQWRVDPHLARHVRWVSANLVNEEEVRPLAVADVIFCRNVFIYFSPDAVRKTVDLFARTMRSPGYLFVAASESLLRLTKDFELEEIGGAFVYVKH